MVEEIAALDERYEASEFEDEEYDRLRAKLVDRILGRAATDEDDDEEAARDEHEDASVER